MKILKYTRFMQYLIFVALYNLTAHASQSYNWESFSKDTVAMNEIIANFSKTKAISDEKFSQYENMFNGMSSYFQTSDGLAAAKKNDINEESYLDSYREWKKVFMMFLYEKYHKSDDQQASSSSDFDQQGDDRSNRTSSENELTSFQQSNADTIAQLSQNLQNNLLGQIDNIKQSLQQMVEGLGEYSNQNKNAFYTNVEGLIQTFRQTVPASRLNAIEKYQDFLRLQGYQIDPLEPSPQEYQFFQVANEIADIYIKIAEELVLQVISKERSEDVSLDLRQALQESDKQDEEMYNQMVAQAQAEANKSWWDDLKESGSRIARSSWSKIKEDAPGIIAEKTEEVLAEEGSKIAKEVGHQLGEAAQEAGGSIANRIPDSAKNIAKKVSDKVKDSSESGILSGSTKEQLKKLSDTLKIDSVSNILSSESTSMGLLKAVIRKKYPVSFPQTTSTITVKTSTSLGTQEQTFLQNRLQKVQKVLKTEFGVNQPLRIAFSCSGGGNRAMVGTLGLLASAAEHKLLDATTYLTGLSGSTWIIAPWSYMYLKGMLSKDYSMSLKEFRSMLVDSLDNPSMIGSKGVYGPALLQGESQNEFSMYIAKRFAYDQTITAIDLYGALIGNFAFAKLGKDQLQPTWSSIAQDAMQGAIPLPLCSSAFSTETSSVSQTGVRTEYEWFESGPFEAGSSVLGYIPTYTLGSTFENGAIKDKNPEYPISFYLGIYGSAFGISFNDIIDKGMPRPTFTVGGIPVSLPVDTWMRKLIDSAAENQRAKRYDKVFAQFPNYSQGVTSSVLKDQDTFGMFDAGMYFNIPLPLLFDRSQREVDLVIMYDSNPADVPALIDASRYFKRKKIAMPDMEAVLTQEKQTKTKDGSIQRKTFDKDVYSIERNILLSKPMTIFNDPRSKDYNKKEPTLLYIPTPKTDIAQQPYNIDIVSYPMITKAINNSIPPYVTPNFKYTRNDIYNLSETMRAIFDYQIDTIKDIMQQLAKKKYEGTTTS